MHIPLTGALTLLLVTAGAQGQGLAAQPTPTRADSLAAALVDELAEMPWGSSCTDWAGTRSDARCEEQPSTGWRSQLDDEWCYRGSAPAAMGARYFHALPYGFAPSGTSAAEAPRVCTLEEYHARMAVPMELVAGLHAAVAGHVEARFGPPQGTERFHAAGAARWEGLLLWTMDGLDVLVYLRSDTLRGGPDVGLLARRRPFVGALAADSEFRRSAWRDPHTDAAAELLRPRSPALADAVAGTTYVGPAPDGDPEMMATLEALLAEAAAGEGEAAAALLFAADYVARQAASTIAPDPRIRQAADPWSLTEPAVERLRALGLTLRWNPLGGAWSYERDLLRRLADELPDSPWGERATVALLRLGWYASAVCAAGGDEFRPVIEHAEAFLRSRPESPFRDEAATLLAQAYETWWSLSLADDDAYVGDPAEYADGAEEARVRAIELYRELLEAAGPNRWLAARQLPRLELGLDTNQRAFFCVYD